jgi:hypothetical protein
MEHLVTKGTGIKGGGFYTSLSGLDSKGFGETLMVFNNAKPIQLITNTFDNPLQTLARYLNPNHSSSISQTVPLIQGVLLNLGLQGFLYPKPGQHTESKTWINLFDTHNLQRFRQATFDDIVDSIDPRPNPSQIHVLMQIDSELEITPSSKVQQHLPTLSRILMGQPLRPEDHRWLSPHERGQAFFKTFYKHILVKGTTHSTFNRLSKSLLRFHQAEVARALNETMPGLADKHSFETSVFSPGPSYDFLATIYNSGIMSSLNRDHAIQIPIAIQNGPRSSLLQDEKYFDHLIKDSNSFLERLLLSLHYIDYPDLLTEVAHHSNEPWARYGNGAFSRFQDLVHLKIRELNSGDPRTHIALEQVHAKLTGAHSVWRDHDIVAGGDLYPDEKSGFYRVTEIQKQRLESNPFILPEFKTDPNSTPNKKTYLARHTYLSIHFYERYIHYLAPVLQQKLKLMKENGLFSQPNSVEYKNATREVVEHLSNYILLRSNPFKNSPTQMYQTLMSIHPFSDYNGRSLRAFIALNYHLPIFLPDWNLDLLLSPLEFALEVEEGKHRLHYLVSALKQEAQRNSGFPRYYDLPAWFEILHSPGTPINTESMKQRYRDEERKELIRQKRFNEIPELCNQIWSAAS